ncbi:MULTISPECIES: peroxiredoxin [unclassified Streptomyces]|uniref:peroxiredoxin n=1 Tax=unclassified Streptomyces TaxID=2593676 RepID=UPI0035E0870F
MSRCPDVGDMVGDFSLPGGELSGDTFIRADYELCRQRGHPVVLAFYPGDNAPVCTKQLCSYSDGLASLATCGARVWGISHQSVDSQERFARSHGLRFPLLADTERAVTRSFGITIPLIGLHRAVFIIGPDRTLHWKHITAVGARFPSTEVIATHLNHMNLA